MFLDKINTNTNRINLNRKFNKPNTYVHIIHYAFVDDVVYFTEQIISAAISSVPKTSPYLHCYSSAVVERRLKGVYPSEATRFHKINSRPTDANKIQYLHLKAISRRTFRQARWPTWKQYLEEINVNTPSIKIFDIVRRCGERSACIDVAGLNIHCEVILINKRLLRR